MLSDWMKKLYFCVIVNKNNASLMAQCNALTFKLIYKHIWSLLSINQKANMKSNCLLFVNGGKSKYLHSIVVPYIVAAFRSMLSIRIWGVWRAQQWLAPVASTHTLYITKIIQYFWLCWLHRIFFFLWKFLAVSLTTQN